MHCNGGKGPLTILQGKDIPYTANKDSAKDLSTIEGWRLSEDFISSSTSPFDSIHPSNRWPLFGIFYPFIHCFKARRHCTLLFFLFHWHHPWASDIYLTFEIAIVLFSSLPLYPPSVVVVAPSWCALGKKKKDSPPSTAQWEDSSSWFDATLHSTLQHTTQQFHSLVNYSVCNKEVHSSKDTFVHLLLHASTTPPLGGAIFQWVQPLPTRNTRAKHELKGHRKNGSHRWDLAGWRWNEDDLVFGRIAGARTDPCPYHHKIWFCRLRNIHSVRTVCQFFPTLSLSPHPHTLD